MRSSVKRKRQLAELGNHVRRWRSLQGMSASELADRAFVTRETLRNIEQGTGAPRLDSVMAVLGVLGIAETVVNSADPWKSESGRALMDERMGASR